MPLITENRQGRGKAPHWTHALRLSLAIFLLVGLIAHSPAQLSTPAAPPPSKAEPAAIPAATSDPLGRETPRSALMGLLKYEQLEDFATAARYLQPTPGQNNLEQRAKEFQALHSKFDAKIALLSDDPNGTIDTGLQPGEVRAGVLAVGDKTTDVILVRVDDPVSGKIWLVSKETIARIPEFYAQMEREGPPAAEPIVPTALSSRHVLGMSFAQWLGWLVSIPICWLLAWLSTFLLSAPRRVWCKLRKLPFITVWDTPLGMPLRCILAILMHGFFVYRLELPLLNRAYYFRFLSGLMVGCFVWFLSSLADRGFDRAVKHSQKQSAGGESILIMMQRLTRVVMLIIAVVAALALFGYNMRTALTGLGIGGLAIALAAQKTLENLIGGVSLLMDKAVQVGDFCQIGDQFGTVEDIGLRSLKMRTLDQNLLIVPNGSLAQMQFQNMARRSKLLINQTFSLQIKTQSQQLQFVLDRVQSMLDRHVAIEPGSCRVRVMSFVGAAFQLELFAYGKTGNWAELTVIRQDVILKIAEIVETSGTRFAAPTQLNYLSSDPGFDSDKANGTLRHVTELQARDSLQFPGESRTGT